MVRSLPIDAQKVTFHDGFISLKQAFEKLESVSTYKIAYNDSQLDVSRKVLMDQKEMEVLLVLSQLLKNTVYPCDWCKCCGEGDCKRNYH